MCQILHIIYLKLELNVSYRLNNHWRRNQNIKMRLNNLHKQKCNWSIRREKQWMMSPDYNSSWDHILQHSIIFWIQTHLPFVLTMMNLLNDLLSLQDLPGDIKVTTFTHTGKRTSWMRRNYMKMKWMIGWQSSDIPN